MTVADDSAEIGFVGASSCPFTMECCTSQSRTSLQLPKSVLSSSGCGREEACEIPLDGSVGEARSSTLFVFANGL